MSRKSQRNRPDPTTSTADTSAGERPAGMSRRAWIAAAVAVVLLAVLAATFLLRGGSGGSASDEQRRVALLSEHAPTLGEPGARVHIVEFLDPACETCALFYPLGKQMLDARPGRIRISTRHVAFHEGADYVVRLLEASRRQDKYWQTLEALLASQAVWAPHHTVQPDLVRQAIAGVGLDLERLGRDMDDPEVLRLVQRDREDARALAVTRTPAYFVNGRPLESFGAQQLFDLVAEELTRAYGAP